MKKSFLFFLFISQFIFYGAHSQHKDRLEYGFKGKVKIVTKKLYPMDREEGEITMTIIGGPIATYSYFFNSTGNLDSIHTERTAPSGLKYWYKTTYNFDGRRKVGWEATDSNGQRLLICKIDWLSDTTYTEQVFDERGVLNNEASTVLNDSFRIVETHVRSYDASGIKIQDNMQRFELDDHQNIIFFIATQEKSRITEKTEYRYLKADSYGNPTELVMTNTSKGTKTFFLFEYVYY